MRRPGPGRGAGRADAAEPGGPVKFVLHPSPRTFLDRALAWLLESEAEHTLVLGLALSRASGEVADDPPAWFGTVEEGDRVVGAVFRTPPHLLGVTALPGDGARRVAEAAAAAFDTLPGVVGEPAAVREVARLWAEDHPVVIRPDMEMAIHELTRLQMPRLPAGRAREGTLDDLPLLTRWVEAFEEDTGIFSTGAEALTRELLRSGAVSLWEVGGDPVSMAATSGATPNAVRVSYVYTPPDLRGRGYAAAVTAHVTRQILDTGYPSAVLYTDRDDPVPNHIYRKLGYRRVASAVTVRFEEDPEENPGLRG